MPYLMQSENAISASEADDMKTSTASSWLMRRDFQYLQEAKPQDVRHFKRNRFFKSAMHAAVQFPDLVPLMWEGGSAAVNNTLSSLPGSKQVEVPSNTCERAHCSCRSGYCASCCPKCYGCRQQSIPAQATCSRSHVSSH